MSSLDPEDDTNRRPVRRGSTEAYVEHGHYFVMHADSAPPVGHYSDWHKGLMLYTQVEGRGGVYVRTGTFYGPVAITVETYDFPEQAVPDRGDWESMQRIDIIATGPNLRIETDGGVEIDLPQLHLAPGEAAGVRLHARGVEKAADVQEIRLCDGAVEHHLLQLWRA